MNKGHSLLLASFISLLIFGHAQFCFSEVYSGIIVEKTKDGKGIPGVLVGAGYGLEQTETDSLGRFSLEVNDCSMKPRLVLKSYPNLIIRWNMRKRQLDLNAAPEIKSVSIHRPTVPAYGKKHLAE